MRLEPAAVINAAAYTQVDRAETDRDTCFRVNAEAVKTLADVCRELDCPLMQVSTDYVFGADQDRQTPYTVDDQPGPISVYGHSKLAGEQAAATWAKHYIVRTSGLYALASNGPIRGRNFVDTMLMLAKQQTDLRIVNDQRCTPTYAPCLAEAMLRLLETGQFGTYHITAKGSATWLEFATELFHQAGIAMSLSPITTEEYGLPAPRPRFSVLDTSSYCRLGVGDLPAWQIGLRDYLELLSKQSN